jgi:hypothetical protein
LDVFRDYQACSERIYAAISSSEARGPDSPADCLEKIREDEALMSDARNRQSGISLDGRFEAMKGLGIFIPVEGKPGYYRFTDFMIGPDESYTKTLINAMIGELKISKSGAVREVAKAAILNQINIERLAAVTEKKALWHIIEQGVVPIEQQQGGFVTQINRKFRDNPDMIEKICIVSGTEAIMGEIKRIKSIDPNALIDIALSDESQLEMMPDDKDLKMLVFKTKNFIQLEGVVAALRALHSDDALSALLRIYSVMAGEPYKNPPDSVIEDAKEFARRLVFDLPNANPVPLNEIPKLNERLIQLLTAA